MIISFANSIHSIGKTRWNSITGTENPFLRFEFLAALETHDCVGKNQGWIAQHLIIEDTEGGEILGLMPLYLKTNSYGELVFDWSWAEAYLQVGRHYYPKLVSAIPYTPVTSQRLFVAKGQNEKRIRGEMINALKQIARDNHLSSIHCLFPPEETCADFTAQGFISRLGCQFHWHNLTDNDHNYESFAHFLSCFASRKRKNINKERKRCAEQGISFQILSGSDIAPDLWPRIYHFYQKTFIEKGGYASFTQTFFEEISQTMGHQLVVVLAIYKGDYVASAISYRNHQSLYGRHWGCTEKFDSLHFETCYYQGIDYAIEHKLQLFEPGAQGEHKISRGFVPTETWSTHWIKDNDFRQAISQFVDKEKDYMHQYISASRKHLPFKKDNPAAIKKP